MAALTGPLTPLCFIRVFARFLNKTQHSTEGCHGFIFRLFLTGITGNYLAQKNSSANPRNSSRSSGWGFESREENFTFSEPALSAGACRFSTSSCLLRMNPTSAAGRMQWAHHGCPAPGWTGLVWRLRLHIPCFSPMSSRKFP